MHSSEARGAAGFLRLLGVSLLLCCAAGLALTWIWDPLGALGERRGFPSLCADGIKSDQERLSIPLLGARHDARILITGSSRTRRGFIREHWQTYTRQPSVNLSMSSQTLEELFQIVAPLIDHGTLQEIWIGLDLGMFLAPPPAGRGSRAPAPARNPDLAAYRNGLFSGPAIRETLLAMASRRSCRQLVRGPDGFSDLAAVTAKPAAETDEMHLAHGDSAQAAAVYRRRMDLFSRLVSAAVAKEIEVRLFITPSAPGYFNAVTAAGEDLLLTQWRRETRELAARLAIGGRVRFADFSSALPPPLPGEAACAVTPEWTCDFFDAVHFRPHIGRRILHALAHDTDASPH